MHAFDVEVFERVARLDAPALDRTLPRLSTAASYSRIWIGISLALLVRGGRPRRAALAALAAVAVTSALANLGVKLVSRRRRPTSPVPEARRLEHPASTSFPSGHSASAAAFAGVVGHQVPELWLPINALAGSVAFSRVYTGVHYPGDVVIGWLLGRSVASATNLVLRRVPAFR